MVCLLLTSCTQNNHTNIHTTGVTHQLGLQEYGPYVFFSDGQVKKYNRITNELTKACTDPECDGKCLLESVITKVNRVIDGKLYFSAFTAYTHEFTYACLDILSGETSVLVQMTEAEDSGNAVCGVCDGYFYYIRKVLKDGGDKSKLSDYEPYFCRVPVDGGNETKLMPTDGAVLFGIADGKFIVEKDGVLCALDAVSGSSKPLFDFSEHGYTSMGSVPYIYENLFYFTCKNASQNSFLIGLDTESGEFFRITEEPVFSFCVTDDSVYYCHMVMKNQEFINEDGTSEIIPVQAQGKNLMQCGHDGNDTRICFNAEAIYLGTNYTVIDGELIGNIVKSDGTNDGDKPSAGFGKLNLSDGSVTFAVAADK